MRNCLYILLLGMLVNPAWGQNKTSYSADQLCQRTTALLYSLNQFHWKPNELSPQLGQQIFDTWITLIDPSGEFLTDACLANMHSYREELHKLLQVPRCEFVDALHKTYRGQVQLALKFLDEMETYPLNYQEEEFMYHSKSHSLHTDSLEWADRWRRRTKLNVLESVYWWSDTLDISEESLYIAFLEKEPTWRHHWLDQQRCRLRNLAHPGDSKRHVFQTFLQAIAQTYDPHTVYFSPEEKEQFEAMLSTNALSFGLNINKNNRGDWVVSHIVPGGPAWQAPDLAEEDIVIEVKLGSAVPLDLGCLTSFEVSMAILTSSANTLYLKTRQSDGKLVTTTLHKATMAVEENTIDTWLLEGDLKVGYVNLPSFYTSFENEDVPGCSDDVASEIVRLKRAGMEGLVLDLRRNGGGSITEALSLAGIFVDYGPLTLEDNSLTKLTTLRDWNRGVIFQGPLVVLVSGNSASASEILAATLQDWQKAIILGTTTFGKATGQIIVPIGVSMEEPMKFRRSMEQNTLGFLKVTTSAYFRLDGHAYQGQGVQPDIVVPDIWQPLYPAEKDQANSLVTGSVDKKVFYSPGNLPRTDLAARATSRLKQDTLMQTWHKLQKEVAKRTRDGAKLPLQWDAFMSYEKNYVAFFRNIQNSLARKSLDFVASGFESSSNLFSTNAEAQERQARAQTYIQGDPVIAEAYAVIRDWVSLDSQR